MFGKFGGYLAAGTGVIGFILGLVFGGMWAGNAAITAEPSASSSASESPTGDVASSPTPSEEPDAMPDDTPADMTPVNDPDFPDVRYKYELDFFALAVESCDQLKRSGAIIENSDGSKFLLGLNKDGLIARVNLGEDGVAKERYIPQFDFICGPADVLELSRSKWADETYADHFHLDWMIGSTYCWHQHIGSADMSSTYFTFENRVLVSISDRNEDYSSVTVKFGLTKAQKALLQDVDF
jgi:hypothetical protein